MTEFSLPLPPALIAELADQVADRLAARIAPPPEAYIGSEEAAAYIGYRGEKASGKMSELVATGKLPERRDGKRLLFRHSDLDAYVTSAAVPSANGRH